MADDLLSKVAGELEKRLGDLRPLVVEYERLLAAAAALERAAVEPAAERSAGGPVSRRKRRARGAQRASAQEPAAPTTRRGTSRRGKRSYAPRGAAQKAIIAALEHGSHTSSELVSITALAAATIRSNLQRLLKARVITRTRRGGRGAYALA